MIDNSKLLMIAAVFLGCAGLAAAIMNPALVSNTRYLSALVFLELIVASLWLYKDVFFLFLLLVFLWAGTGLPLREEMLIGRWVVLGVGAWAGVVVWLKGRHQHKFSTFHLVALFLALTAILSSTVSSAPRAAMLKGVSLFLLFLYASFGARAAFENQENRLLRILVYAFEYLTFASAIAYFVLRFEVFGNPNALGAVMGVVAIPILLWDVLTNQDKLFRTRRTLALILAGALLFRSLSRASILAAAVVVVLICLVLRERIFLARAAFVVVVALAFAGVVEPASFDRLVASVTSDVLYKGKTEQAVYASRERPWGQAVASLEQHPWFGSGFGTSENALDSSADAVASNGDHREQGSSYLALAVYLGFAGLLPFTILLILLGRKLVQTWLWVWRSGNFGHYCVPLASVVTAALIHAVFEDWLTAPGFYLCVLFWPFAFALIDFSPTPLTQPLAYAGLRRPGGTVIDPRFAPFPPRPGLERFR